MNNYFYQGPIISQEKIRIYSNDTVLDVNRRITEKGERLLKQFFKLVPSGQLTGYPQNPEKASYFPLRTPRDSKINWNNSAESICNLVRALTYPYPGAYFYFKGKKIVIERARVIRRGPKNISRGVPVLHNNTYLVKTGLDFLKITHLRNRETLAFEH